MSIKRMTNQRRAILAVLAETQRPMSPEEILELARREVEKLNQATVYRNLTSLIEDKQLVRVELLGKPPRYELAGLAHHHHFLCQECDRMFDLPGCHGLLKQAVPPGFEATGHELVMFGRCKTCV